jgi:hypothetical protein
MFSMHHVFDAFIAQSPLSSSQAGRDALLDVARATYNDNYDDILKLIQQYRDEFGSNAILEILS